jgi:hypothetical protein
MAQRKEDLNHIQPQFSSTSKKTFSHHYRYYPRTTPPHQTGRITKRPLDREYLGDILEETVPKEEYTIPQERRHITHEAIERLKNLREQIIRDRGGKLFEGSVKMIRQIREERTLQLIGELWEE